MLQVPADDLKILALFLSEYRDTSTTNLDGESIHLENNHLFLKDGSKQLLIAQWSSDDTRLKSDMSFYGTKADLGLQIQYMIAQVLSASTKKIDNTCFFISREGFQNV